MLFDTTVQREGVCFAPTSLLFVAADAYSQSFCEFFCIANVNSFFITEPSEDNIIQQLF